MGNTIVTGVDVYLVLKSLQMVVWMSNNQAPIGWHQLKDPKTRQEDSVQFSDVFRWPSPSLGQLFYNANHEKGDSILVYNTLLQVNDHQKSTSFGGNKNFTKYMHDNMPKQADFDPAAADDYILFTAPTLQGADMFRLVEHQPGYFEVEFRQPVANYSISHLMTSKYK